MPAIRTRCGWKWLAPAGQRVGVANEGFHGIAVGKGAQYQLSLYARAADGFSRPAGRQSGRPATGGVLPDGKIDGSARDWKKFECTLTASDTDRRARLVVAATAPGTLWLDMVSLFPKDTWKGRPNGLRRGPGRDAGRL